MVVRYVERRRFKKLGLTAPLDSIDADTADAMLLIDSYLDELREMDADKARRKGKGKGG